MWPGQSGLTELDGREFFGVDFSTDTVQWYPLSTDIHNPLLPSGWNQSYVGDAANSDSTEPCSLQPELCTQSSSLFETFENAVGLHDSVWGWETPSLSANDSKKRKDRDDADFPWEQTGPPNKKRPYDPYLDDFSLFHTGPQSNYRAPYRYIFPPPQSEPSFVSGAAETKKRKSRGDALPPPSTSRSRGLTSQTNSSESSGLSSLGGKSSGMGNGDDPDGSDARQRCTICGELFDNSTMPASTQCGLCMVKTRMQGGKIVNDKIEGDEHRSKPLRASRLGMFSRRRETASQQQPVSVTAPSSTV